METLEMLIANEQSVAGLYAVYADRFEQEKAFWQQKSQEENTHAQLLQGVLQVTQELSAFFDKERFNPDHIRQTQQLVSNALEKAHTCTLGEALEQAREIESTLIESEFFKVIQGDSLLVRSAFTRIQQDTKKHREQIQEKKLQYSSR